jgi:hypothetical protein
MDIVPYNLRVIVAKKREQLSTVKIDALSESCAEVLKVFCACMCVGLSVSL